MKSPNNNIEQVKKFIWNIIASGLPLDFDIEIIRKFVLLNIITILGFCFLGLLSAFAFYQGDNLLVLIDFATLLILVLLFVMLRIKKNYQLIGVLGAIIIGLFYLFLVSHGGIHNATYLWALTYPLVVLYLLGKKIGSIFSLALLSLSIIVIEVTTKYISVEQYNTEMLIRFVATYLTIFFFGFVGEIIHQIVHGRLKESRNQLQISFKKVQESEKKYRDQTIMLETILDAIPDVLGVQDLKHRIIQYNKAGYDFINSGLNEVVGKHCFQLIGRDKPCKICATSEVYRTKQPARFEKYTPEMSLWLDVRAYPIFDEQGQMIKVIEHLRDITSQKLAEEALREGERRFRELFNSISDLVYTHDHNGRLLSVNPALCQLFGYDDDELVGRRLSAFMKPGLADSFENEYMEKVLKNGRHEGTSIFLTEEGNEIYIEYRSSVVYPKEKEPYISGTGRDVTERVLSERDKQKLQTQLIQAQKMESIGILAGGIAHNFNNILMGIQGHVSLMMDNNPPNSSHEHLRGIDDYVKNAGELTRDLLGFARGGKYEVKPTDINTLIEHENKMFGRTKKEIRIHGSYEKGLWAVEVDQNQIRQALLNLYVNAWQAMPDGGDLYVQTENVTLDKEYIKPFEVTPGRYVKISVTDTGIGMDAATREKIFDPFFSTKNIGQGSGLGLSSLYGIIKNHEGLINVYSEKGEGTTFNIYLPASEKEAVEEAPQPGRYEVQYGQGTILLIDDEEMILTVGPKMLEKLGYQTFTAGSGQEALYLYEKHRGNIDLVILDMVMPDMGGGETFDRLNEIDQDVRVLLSSGYSINGHAQEILDRGCSGFIQKPFAMVELSRKIYEALDGAKH